MPKGKLLQKAADLLDIPVASFDELSPDIPLPVKHWLTNNPFVERAFRLLKTHPEPERLIARLEQSGSIPVRPRYPIAIYESELQAIGLESATWNTETGGDLFGTWGDIPIIYLASRAGPRAQREAMHFRLDVDYLIRLSAILAQDWGLRYFGDWHSHHRLGLRNPSRGDQKRIANLAHKNSFDQMAEIITTFTPGRDGDNGVRIHPYVYQDFPSYSLTEAIFVVLRGVSPVRSALIATSSFPEQELGSFSSYPMEKVVVPDELLGRVPGSEGFAIKQISEKFLDKIMSNLASVASGEPELYRENFGFVIVVPVSPDECVALALHKKWPHRLLQINWIDRSNSRTDELLVDKAPESALDLRGLKQIISTATDLRRGESG